MPSQHEHPADSSGLLRTIFTMAGVRRGFVACLPLGVSVAAYGVVFGVLAAKKGLAAWHAGLMSAMVFAGASQLMSLELWPDLAGPSPWAAVAALAGTVFVVNLRHTLMGMSLRRWTADEPAWRSYACLFFMTDESWALSVREIGQGGPNGRDAGFGLGAGLCVYVFWLSSTWIGAGVIGAASQAVDPVAWGLDFAFTAVFTALLVFLWRGRESLLPWVAAGVSAWVCARLLPGKWYVVIGGLTGGFVGAMTGIPGKGAPR